MRSRFAYVAVVKDPGLAGIDFGDWYWACLMMPYGSLIQIFPLAVAECPLEAAIRGYRRWRELLPTRLWEQLHLFPQQKGAA